ncbi:MAG: hypothetical protein ACRBN8_45830 [Nannocystales bacterium]
MDSAYNGIYGLLASGDEEWRVETKDIDHFLIVRRIRDAEATIELEAHERLNLRAGPCGVEIKRFIPTTAVASRVRGSTSTAFANGQEVGPSEWICIRFASWFPVLHSRPIPWGQARHAIGAQPTLLFTED